MAVNKVPRLPYLDTARGFSALSVTLWHFLVLFIPLKDPDLIFSPAHIFYYAQASVMFFFVHSGFILCHSYSNKILPLTVPRFLRFLIERIFRILPLFLFVLTVGYLFKRYYSADDSPYITDLARKLWRSSVSFGEYLRQSFLFYRFPDQEYKRILNQDWTLTIELVAGAFIPILLALITKRTWLFALAALVFIKLFTTYIFEFSIGIAIYYFSDQISLLWMRMNRMVKAGIFILAILFYTCFFRFGSIYDPGNIVFSLRIDRLVVTLGCALIFILLLNVKKLQQLLSASWLVFTGRLCYSLYLWHILFLFLFAAQLLQCFHKEIGWSMGLSMVFVFIIYWASTILISIFSYFVIEKPFIALGKSIGSRFINYFDRGNATGSK